MNEVKINADFDIYDKAFDMNEYLNTLSLECERDSRRYNRAFSEESEVGTV